MAKSKAADVPHLSLQNQDPRSHRYEVDENAAFSPPSSSHMFQIFDSSEVYSQHPRKYDLLIAKEDSSGQSSPEIVHQKRRSKSVAGLEFLPSSAEYKNLLEKAHPSLTMPEVKPDAKEDSLSVRSQSSRRVSVAVMDRTRITSDLPSQEDLKPSPLSKTDQDVGQLSKLFKVAFGTGSSWQSQPQSQESFPEEEFTGQSSQKDFGTGTKTQESSATSSCKTSVDELEDLVPVTVYPEPRRLFGFGPSYQPPAETVLMPADQAKTFGAGTAAGGSLVDKVKQAGITAMDGPTTTTRQRKTGMLRPPTGEEMNTWAPFST